MLRLALLAALLPLPLHAQDADRQLATYCDRFSSGKEHAGQLAAACRFVLQLQDRLPNFVCEQSVTRYAGPAGNMARTDVIRAQVTYQGGDQRFADVTVDGKPVADDFAQLSGMWSVGEFGNYLLILFVDTSQANFRFARQEKLDTHSAVAFDFSVAAANNRSYQVVVNGASFYPAFEGRLWIDAATAHPLRLDYRAPELAGTAQITRSEMTIRYAGVPLGDGTTFLLPVQSETFACRRHPAICSRNVTAFSACRKFTAKSRILPDSAAPPPPPE